jgi:hypothetical protein
MNAIGPKYESGHDGDKTPSFDAELKAALHDVAVPDDLANRILARLKAAGPAQSSTGQMPVPPRHGRQLNRRALIAVGSLALLALIAVSTLYLRQAPRPVAREELGGEVTLWLSSLPAKSWRPVSTLPKATAIDQAVVGHARQWQALHGAQATGWSGSVTAIDLAPPTAPRAILFVVRSNARFAVPSTPTATVRLGLSSGFVGTAWQRPSGVLYVLVVEADRGQRLEDFLRQAVQA